MPTVIVTDVKYRMAVPAVRDLSRRGWRVVCAEYERTPRKQALGFFSRACAQTATLPWEEPALVDALGELCRAQPEKPVLLPFGRRTLGVLSRAPELRQAADFLVPTPQALALADNKYKMAALAKELGVPAPATASLADFLDQDSPLEALSQWAPIPCVVKYRNGEALGLHPVDRYRIVSRREELAGAYRAMHERQECPLVQEYVAGEGVGVSVVMDQDGGLRDFICHRRLREYPVTGGPSCLCQSAFDRRALEYACALLRGVSFAGVAMVEFKGGLDAPRLMEINPRFWGASPLVAVSGSPFYQRVLEAAQGRGRALDPASCQPEYQVGKRMRFTPQDLLAFPGYWKRRPDKLRFAGGFARDLVNPLIRDGLFRLADPAPYFRYLLNALGGGDR